MPIKAVLFDMFDTLMLIEKNHAFYSPAIKSMHQYLFQNGINVSFAVFRDEYIKARDQLYDQADQKMEEPHFNIRIKNTLQNLGYVNEAESNLVQGATDVFCREFMNFVCIDEDVDNVLNELKSTYRLGVVSNFAIPECVYRLLEQHELKNFFDIIIVSASINKRKPSPDIFKYALEKLQLSPSEVVFVGDTVDADVKGPKELGMKTIYIERRPQKDLETIRPDHSIKRLYELAAAIRNL